MSLVADGEEVGIEQLAGSDCICITLSGKPVKPKTLGQKQYVKAIDENTIVFGIGPAGTGKTYLAVAQVLKPQGITGELKCKPLTDDEAPEKKD